MPKRILGVAAVAWLALMPAGVAAVADFAGAHAFPALRDMNGKTLADGDFSQWIDGGRLHVRIAYQFAGGRRVEEQAVLRSGPPLVQDEWSWRETQGSKIVRRFAVNLGTGMATAEKVEGGDVKRWSEQLDVKKGQTFSGFGFAMAIIDARARLIKGEKVELQAVGFTPKPRVVTVEIAHGGVDSMRMSGRTLRGDHFIIHPKIPWIATLFIKVPDTQIWLTNPLPAAFLRWEGPMAEPGDAVVRVDLLPGGESDRATPVTR